MPFWVSFTDNFYSVTSNTQLLTALPSLLTTLTPSTSPESPFQDFYKYMFNFAKATPETKSVTLENALAFLPLLLKPERYNLKFDPDKPSKTKGAAEEPFPH